MTRGPVTRFVEPAPQGSDDWHGRRAALRAREEALDAKPRDPTAPALCSASEDDATIEAEAVAALRARRA